MIDVSAIDRLIRAAKTERFTAAKLVDAIAELEDVREWAETLTDLAEALENLGDAVESWQQAEGRDDKADARAEVVDYLEAVAAAHDDLTALPDMGLGSEVMP